MAVPGLTLAPYLDENMAGTPLDRSSIGHMIKWPPHLLEGFLSLESQLQPNGFDMTVRDVARLTNPGAMGKEDYDRVLSEAEPIEFRTDGWLQLEPGPYLITFNEVVNLPLGVMALGQPRSSLLRSGVSIHTAVWDAGYHGRSQALLVVYNLSLIHISEPTRLYAIS